MFQMVRNIDIYIGAHRHTPVVVSPTHHVLIGGCGGDFKPLDVFIGAKKEGVVSGSVVRWPDEKTGHLTNYRKGKGRWVL